MNIPFFSGSKDTPSRPRIGGIGWQRVKTADEAAFAATPEPQGQKPPSDTILGALVKNMHRTYASLKTRKADVESEIARLTEELRQVDKALDVLASGLIDVGPDKALTTDECMMTTFSVNVSVDDKVAEEFLQVLRSDLYEVPKLTPKSDLIFDTKLVRQQILHEREHTMPEDKMSAGWPTPGEKIASDITKAITSPAPPADMDHKRAGIGF